jgi:hypothetical protein
MTEALRLNPIKRVKAVFSQDVSETALPKTTKTVKRILRILLRDPWDDFDYVMSLDQGALAIRKGSFFKLVSIQPFQGAAILQQTRMLAGLQHPNVASIYDVYSHGEEQFLIMEHLSVRISHLKFQEHELEEWEIATIISEVGVICYFRRVGLR